MAVRGAFPLRRRVRRLPPPPGPPGLPVLSRQAPRRPPDLHRPGDFPDVRRRRRRGRSHVWPPRPTFRPSPPILWAAVL